MTPSQVAMGWEGRAAVLRECCSAITGNALSRCLGRQSPRASQCKSQLADKRNAAMSLSQTGETWHSSRAITAAWQCMWW